MKATRISNADKDILQELGRQIVAAAADPVNDERRDVRRRIENREPGRPSVDIYQEPWSELNQNGELDLHCEGRGRAIPRLMTLHPLRWDSGTPNTPVGFTGENEADIDSGDAICHNYV